MDSSHLQKEDETGSVEQTFPPVENSLIPLIAAGCHCLVCGSIKNDGVIKSEANVEGSEELTFSCPSLGKQRELENLQCFKNLFGSQLKWDQFEKDLGDEVLILLFCKECSSQLGMFMKLKRELDELERCLREKLVRGEKVAAGSTDNLQKTQYKKIRRGILNIESYIHGSTVSFPEPGVTNATGRNKSVRSVQKPTKKLTLKSTRTRKKREPIVSVSPINPVNEVDDCQSQLIKQENDSNNFEDNDLFSASPLSSAPPSPPPPVKLEDDQPPEKKKRNKRKLDDDDDPEWTTTDDQKKDFRQRPDPKTGTISYFNVALEKLGDTYKCSLCDKILPNNRPIMKSHVVQFHTQLFECPQCQKHFGSNALLRRHSKMHNPSRPKVIAATCPICMKPILNKGHLKQHIWSHYNEQERLDAIAAGEQVPPGYDKPFQCDQCPRSFPSRWFLSEHQKRVHASQEERSKLKVLCPVCGVSVLDIKHHMKRVHGEGSGNEKKFVCSFCDKRFINNFTLRQHKTRMHDAEKMWKCELCPKEFATRKQLDTHVSAHLNIRPFQCSHCSSAFTKKHHLSRHVENYHTEGCVPGRPSYVRGPEVKVGRKTKEVIQKFK